MNFRRILHAGCGCQPLPAFIEGYKEVRLDIDPVCLPDIVASMTDMGDIGEFDMVYTCHALEHFFPHEVPVVLSECLRVLKKGGALIIIVPNLEGIKPDKTIVYDSPGGPITGHDMFYGKSDFVEINKFMAHHCGFVPETLKTAMCQAGFREVVISTTVGFNLLGVGIK